MSLKAFSGAEQVEMNILKKQMPWYEINNRVSLMVAVVMTITSQEEGSGFELWPEFACSSSPCVHAGDSVKDKQVPNEGWMRNKSRKYVADKNKFECVTIWQMRKDETVDVAVNEQNYTVKAKEKISVSIYKVCDSVLVCVCAAMKVCQTFHVPRAAAVTLQGPLWL